LRERVAEQTAAAQRDAEEARRVARAEAVRLVGEAQAEAEQLRAQARRALDEARAEVAALATRRDEIAEELGRLSGVIEALSVGGVPAGSGPRPAPSTSDADVPR
jgi:uncharacterized membrane protein YqiK